MKISRILQRVSRNLWLARSLALVAIITVCLLAAFVPTVSGEDKPIKNPLGGDPASIQEGASLFRANCAMCHGLGAKGGSRGPDLSTNRWVHGSGDGDIFNTITQGVAGTEMPGVGFPDSEIWSLVAYLRSLAPPKEAPAGNVAEGEKIFAGSGGCSQCHMIKGVGGRLGPDLSRVGAARSVSYLIDSIREPSKDLSKGMFDPNNPLGLSLVCDTVTLVTAKGQKITGVVKNEDAFSIQFMDTEQNLQVFLKKDLKEVTHERKSLMPPYSEEMLGPAALQNLVAYLQSLRGN